MRIQFLTFLAIPLMLSGCLTVAVDPASQPELRSGAEPNLNQPWSVGVGEAIYTEFNYVSSFGATPIKTQSQSLGFNTIQIAAGSYLAKAQVGGVDAYCTTNGNAYTAIGGEYRNICLYDTNKSGQFDKYWVMNTMGTQYDLTPPLPYKLVEKTTDAGGFRYELLYQGIQGDTLRVAYREFKNDMARPAFQQDLTYTMSKSGPTEIGFRGVNISVSSANNAKIDYIVRSGFSAKPTLR